MARREKIPGPPLLSRPDERCHLLDAPLPGQRHYVTSPVVQSATFDQGDPRLEHRRAPVQGILYHPVRVPPAPLPLLEPPYVLSPVSPVAPLPLNRLRTYHPPANVRIQSRQTDPQLLSRPPRVEIPLLHRTTSSTYYTSLDYCILICKSILIHTS